MKIEIIAPEPPFTRGYTIKAKGKRIINRNCNGYEFSEAEIEYILNDGGYEKFEKGQYEFDIPLWQIKQIEGINTEGKRERILFGYNYTLLR